MERAARGHLALFAYYYPPLGGAGSQRALSVARHLPAHGWRVTVFTPREGVYGKDPSLDGGGLPGVEVVRTESREVAALLRNLRPGVAAGDPGGKFVEEAQVGPVGATLRGLARRFLYFPDSARGWIGSAAAAAAEVHRRDPFHLALSTSPPLSGHVAAHRFARAAGIPFVADFRDLPWREPERPGGRLPRLVEGLLEEARAVVTVSPTCARWFDGLGGEGKTRVVWNGYEPAPGPDPMPAPPAPGGEILYAGSTYADRQDFSAFLGVVEGLRAGGAALSVRFAGKIDPGTRERIEPFRVRGVVHEEGFVERRRVLELQARAAAVLVWCWEGSDAVGLSQVPVKLFEAIPSSRPILLVASPGSDAEAAGRRLGLSAVAHADLAGMEARLRALAAGREPPGLRPVAGAAAEFTREAQAARLAEVLAEAAAPAVRA